MSNPRYGSGRKQFIGQGIEADLGKLDPAAYPGAVAYSDGELWYSDGSEWVVPQDEVDIARPRNLSPTNATEQAQLRLSAFRSPTGETQTGIIYEINTDGLPNFGEGANLITRVVTSQVASLYQLVYPDDGFQPGETIWWRARYLGTNGTQSQYSIPTAQIFPDLITTPLPVTPSNAITGTVTLTPYDSAPVFGISYYQTQVEFYAIGDVPGVATPLATVTQSAGATTTVPVPPLVGGLNYQWRGRYTGRVTVGSPTITSEWSTSRTIFLGATSIVLEYSLALMTARTVYIPLGFSAPGIEPYSVTINWGDGTSNTYTSGGVKSKTYPVGFAPSSGRVLVTVSGRMTRYGTDGTIDQNGLVRVENIGFSMGLTSLERAFQETRPGLEYFTPDLPETVTNLSLMFFRSTANPLGVSSMNTSNVTNMSSIFYEATAFNQPIGSWNTSKVTNMAQMFYGAYAFNQPIGGWDVSKVTSMFRMFRLAIAFNQPIGTWDVSSVTDMSEMMMQASVFNQNVGAWNTANVTTFQSLFNSCPAFNNGGSPAINNLNTAKVTNMSATFANCNIFNQPVGGWSTGNVTTMNSMFSGAFPFNQPLNSWDVSKVTNMAAMFQNCNVFNQPLGAWNTIALTAASSMFYIARAFNQPIGTWNVSNLLDATNMFLLAESFNQDLGAWNVGKVTGMAGMFYLAPFNNGGSPSIGNWDTSKVTDMTNMFLNNGVFNQPIGNWNLTSCTSLVQMFQSNLSFNQDVGGWDLRPAGVNMSSIGFAGMNQENYSRTLIGWANYVATADGPYTVPVFLNATRQYNANNYVTGTRFTNATAARAFLVGGRVVSVTGASDTNANTTYTYNGTTQTYDAANGWKFAILGSSWGLYNASAVLQSTGSGGGIGTGPHVTTSWTGVLSAATVLRTGASWTITGDAAA